MCGNLKSPWQTHYHLPLPFYTEVRLENGRNCLTQEGAFLRWVLICSDKYTHLKYQLLETRMWGVGGGGEWDAAFPEKGFGNKAKPM